VARSKPPGVDLGRPFIKRAIHLRIAAAALSYNKLLWVAHLIVYETLLPDGPEDEHP
jgi:hypothetical protein